MNKDFKNDLINKIKKDKIKPISKNFFIAKNILIYLFLWFSILIWALSIAIVFWYLFEADWFLSHKIGLLKVTTTFLPIFWLIFLFFSSVLSYYNFKQTEKWYKFYLWQIILSNILISFVVWILFYFSWFSQKVEDKIQNNISNYREIFVWDKISRMKKIWQDEEKWLLLWVIIKIKNNIIKLKDTNNKSWDIKILEKTIIRHELELRPWLKIKLIWEKKSENKFVVSEIRPFIWNWKWIKENHNKE
jgi:ABC-type multidrug transport system fused ATPase/permease subunit